MRWNRSSQHLQQLLHGTRFGGLVMVQGARALLATGKWYQLRVFNRVRRQRCCGRRKLVDLLLVVQLFAGEPAQTRHRCQRNVHPVSCNNNTAIHRNSTLYALIVPDTLLTYRQSATTHMKRRGRSTTASKQAPPALEDSLSQSEMSANEDTESALRRMAR